MSHSAHTEIERRFLVRVQAWAAAAPAATREHLVQVYLAAGEERTVRVRLRGERAVLTVKGRSVDGARTEVESDISAAAAFAILDARLYAGTPVEKTRSTLFLGQLVWEVDQFEGTNAGLVIAEVELAGEPDARKEWEARVDREQPEWLGPEITGDSRFTNSSLALRPFATWPEAERDAVLAELES
jgi:adenylate cyclase